MHYHMQIGVKGVSTHLDVRPPSLLAGSHCPRIGVVEKLWVLPQAPPQPELLARIVALVDEMPLVGVGTMPLGQGLHGAVPGLLLEAVVVLEAQLDALAQRTEKRGLISRCPAEAWTLPVGRRVLASCAGASWLDGFRRAVVLAVRHCRRRGQWMECWTGTAYEGRPGSVNAARDGASRYS